MYTLYYHLVGLWLIHGWKGEFIIYFSTANVFFLDTCICTFIFAFTNTRVFPSNSEPIVESWG